MNDFSANILRMLGGFLATLLLVYIVGGFASLYMLAEIANKQYRNFAAEAAKPEPKKQSERYKIPDEAEALAAKVALKPEAAVVVPVPVPVRKNSKLPVTHDEKFESLAKVLKMADGIVNRSSGFDPCHSICNESNFDQYPRGEGMANLLKNLTDYYETSQDAALNDPVFNSVILVGSELQQVLSPQMIKLAARWRGPDRNVVMDNPIRTIQLLTEIPGWLFNLPKMIKRTKKNTKIIMDYRDLNNSCRNSEIDYANASKYCKIGFQEYAFTRRTDTSPLKP